MSDLNRRMAEAMGWELTSLKVGDDPPKPCFFKKGWTRGFMPYCFAESIEYCFDEVVPFMRERGWNFDLFWNIREREYGVSFGGHEYKFYFAYASTPAEAIVKAALKALGGEQ